MWMKLQIAMLNKRSLKKNMLQDFISENPQAGKKVPIFREVRTVASLQDIMAEMGKIAFCGSVSGFFS
jgi:hypothetical protein